MTARSRIEAMTKRRSPKPTPRQRKVVDGLLNGMSQKAAARSAGYTEVSATSSTSIVQSAAVRRLLGERLRRNELSADRTLEEIRRLAFSDVRRLFDEQGNLRPIHSLSDEDAAAVAGIEVIIKNAEAGDGHLDRVHRIKLWDKSKNLEQLAKHFRLVGDLRDVADAVNGLSGALDRAISEGRARAAGRGNAIEAKAEIAAERKVVEE